MKNTFFLLFLINLLISYSQVFELPKLKYSYNALEPFIDAQTMEIHYSKHHKAYVANLNKALGNHNTKSLTDILLSVSRSSDALRNNAGGHYNHTLFWEILTPNRNSKISEELIRTVIDDFVNLDSLKKIINKEAATRFGSGWAWLIVTPDKKLKVCSTPNQDNPLMDVNPERGIPILGIDVWEHAYYLKYQNKRGDYLEAIWEVIDWEEVSRKYAEALTSPLLEYIEMDTWKSLKEFHKILSETFHPTEVNDFLPIKNKSSELAMKAINLKQSFIPKMFNREDITIIIDEIVKKSNELHKLVTRKASNKELGVKLTEIHGLFHKIQEKCYSH
jgi:superoxide dismutase